MMLAQMNPDLLSQLGGGASGIVKEMERIEKTKELKVGYILYTGKVYIVMCVPCDYCT